MWDPTRPGGRQTVLRQNICIEHVSAALTRNWRPRNAHGSMSVERVHGRRAAGGLLGVNAGGGCGEGGGYHLHVGDSGGYIATLLADW